MLAGREASVVRRVKGYLAMRTQGILGVSSKFLRATLLSLFLVALTAGSAFAGPANPPAGGTTTTTSGTETLPLSAAFCAKLKATYLLSQYAWLRSSACLRHCRHHVREESWMKRAIYGTAAALAVVALLTGIGQVFSLKVAHAAAATPKVHSTALTPQTVFSTQTTQETPGLAA